MHTYPKEILPNPNFSIIHTNFSNQYLLRKTNSKDLFNPSTGLIKDELITDRSSGMFGYSTNLFGIFKIEHLGLNLNISPEKNYFTTYWKEGEKVKFPIFGKDYTVDEEYGYFFIPISKIENINIPFEKGDTNTQYICSSIVKHLPTNSNYWHFEIQWEEIKPNMENVEIKPRSKQWIKFLNKTIISIIREFFILETPHIDPISKSNYTIIA